MQRVDHIVRAGHLLTMDASETVIESGALAVSGGVIVDVGAEDDINARYASDSVIGGEGMALMPGFVNTHTHAAMVYMRGMADDMPLMQWLEKHIWPAEGRWMSAEFVADAVELACLEMLKAGVTTFCDMYFFQDMAAEAARRMGMRAVLTSGVIDFPTKTTTGPDDCLAKAEAQIERFKDDPMLTPGIGLHAAYTCSSETIKKARDLALKHDALVTIHLSETEWESGELVKRYCAPPAAYLNSLGLFEARTIASHCVWLSEPEIELLARKKVAVAHCLESNLKLASGIAPVGKMLKAGVKVTIGTDGAASNNDLDVMAEMSAAAKLHKAVSMDATVMDAHTALRMATVNGAEGLGLKNVGRLEKGMAADMILMDMHKPHLVPMYNVASHLVYSARSSDVHTVMVAGRVVVENGRHVEADEDAIMARAVEWGNHIRTES